MFHIHVHAGLTSRVSNLKTETLTRPKTAVVDHIRPPAGTDRCSYSIECLSSGLLAKSEVPNPDGAGKVEEALSGANVLPQPQYGHHNETNTNFEFLSSMFQPRYSAKLKFGVLPAIALSLWG